MTAQIMSIVGRHPSSGVRIVLGRSGDGGPPWVYEGQAYTPCSSHALRVVVQSDGTVCVEADDSPPRDLVQRARQMVQVAYKHAAGQVQPPPRTIQRWRGASRER